MGRQQKRCPCSICKGSYQPYHTWYSHSQQLTRGKRKRWEGQHAPDEEFPANVPVQDADRGFDVQEHVEDQDKEARAYAFEIVMQSTR